MKNKLIDFLRLTLASILIVASTSAIAFKQGGVVLFPSAENHQSITSIALSASPYVQLSSGNQIQFSANAALEVMMENAATDGYFANFNDPDFHFDEGKFDKSSENLVGWRSTIVTLAKDGKFEDARKLLGTSLHLVQDFYAHSNWVERKLIDPSLPLPNLGKPDPFADPKLSIATLATCSPSGLLPGVALTPGYFDNRMASSVNDLGWSTSAWNGSSFILLPNVGWPDGKCVHGADTGSGLNKDQLGRPNYQLAYINAIRGSRMFLNEVVAILKLPGQGGDPAICGLLDQSSSVECRTLITLPATAFVRGTNVALSPNVYGADLLLNAPPYGDAANAAEWDFNVPVAGTYELFAEYAALVSRPVSIAFNGTVKFPNAMSAATGGWFPANLQTLSQGTVTLQAGATTMRVSRSSVFPHIRGFKLVPVPTAP